MKRAEPPIAAGDNADEKYRITSVVRACDVLRAFREPDEILELRDVAARTGFHRSTAFRLLVNLVAQRLLERVGKSGYRSRFRFQASERYRIGYGEQSTVVPYIKAVTESLAVAAHAAGINLLILNNKASRKAALRNVDAFIRQRVDLVIEFQLIAGIANLVSDKLAAAGIPMIAVDIPHPGATYFGPDSYKAGHMAGVHLGRWAIQNWRGVAHEVLLIHARAGGPVLDARLQGIVEGLICALPSARSLPHVDLESKGQFEIAMDAVRKHLRRSRAGQRILIGTVNDTSALGALEAIREFGREDDCAIVSQDCVAEARRELRRAGTRLVGTVAYFPETYGDRLIPLALDILRHQGVPAAIYTRHQLVTPANVNQIYASDLVSRQERLL
jgi:ribose transport system substrate-binding protein